MLSLSRLRSETVTVFKAEHPAQTTILKTVLRARDSAIKTPEAVKSGCTELRIPLKKEGAQGSQKRVARSQTSTSSLETCLDWHSDMQVTEIDGTPSLVELLVFCVMRINNRSTWRSPDRRYLVNLGSRLRGRTYPSWRLFRIPQTVWEHRSIRRRLLRNALCVSECTSPVHQLLWRISG